MMKKIYLHPLPVRIWHWANALLIMFLIITGLQLRFPGVTIFQEYRLVVWLHKYLGYMLALSFLFWFFYYVLTRGLVRHYILCPRDIKAMPHQALYYIYTIFKGGRSPFTPSPDGKFNPLQKVAYSSTMLVLMPVIIITGILFGDITLFLPYINMIGGVRILDAIHVITGYCFVLYLIVHIYMSTLGKNVWSYAKSMITGYAEEPEEEKEKKPESE